MAKNAARRALDASGNSRQQRSHRPGMAQGSSHGRNKKDDPNVRRQRAKETDPRLLAAQREIEENERKLQALDRALAAQSLGGDVPRTPAPAALQKVTLHSVPTEEEPGFVISEPTTEMIPLTAEQIATPETVADVMTRRFGKASRTQAREVAAMVTLLNAAGVTAEELAEIKAGDGINIRLVFGSDGKPAILRFTPIEEPKPAPKPELTPFVAKREDALEMLRQGYHVDRVVRATGVDPATLPVGKDGYHR